MLIDPGGQGLAALAGLPHLVWSPVVCAGEVAERPLALLERRERLSFNEPRVVAFIDELPGLLCTGGREVESHLTLLLQRGCRAGIHAA